MGWFLNKRSQEQRELWGISNVSQLLPADYVRGHHGVPKPVISNDRAMRNSAVWAATRLRADLISTLPLNVKRVDSNGKQFPAPGANLFEGLGGDRIDLCEWLYSSQVELDRSGNSIGVIRERDPKSGYPTRIDLQPTSLCSVIIDQETNELTGYRVRGKTFAISDIWHEKQFTVSGLHVGLSPVAYAAYTLGNYESVEEFALTWFSSAGTPRVSLKNTEKKLNVKEAEITAETWRAASQAGKPFVHGNDWELSFINANAASSDWLNAQKFGIVEIARFFNVPANLIDGAVSGQSVTYANLVSKNLDFLIMHLGPAIIRRERALSKLLPRPRIVELDSDAMLRMDPQTRAQWIKTRIDSRTLTPNEARDLDNLPPLTDDDYKQWELAGLNRTATGALTGAEGMPTPNTSDGSASDSSGNGA